MYIYIYIYIYIYVCMYMARGVKYTDSTSAEG